MKCLCEREKESVCMRERKRENNNKEETEMLFS